MSSLEFVKSLLYKKPVWIAFAVLYLARKLKQLNDPKSKFVKIEPFHQRIRALRPQYFINRQGMMIFTRQWLTAAKEPKGMIFICHGLHEHIGRYENLARELNQRGYHVFGLDHQGHGQSQGERGYIENFDFFVSDFAEFVFRTQQTYLSLDSFLFGHSMGGMIAILLAHNTSLAHASMKMNENKEIDGGRLHVYGSMEQLKPWKGVILSAPAVQARKEDAGPVLIGIAKLLTKIVPKLSLKKLSHEVSGYRQINEQYECDPLNYVGPVRVRMGTEIFNKFDYLKGNIFSMEFPFIILQGNKDKLVEAGGARWFFDHCVSKDKTMKEYDGSYHELVCCVNSVQVLSDVCEWIDERA